MASQALYRKWRSQTFDELVGQEHVVRTLRNAIRAERVGHAYLFTGPRGVGKTSTARLLAKAVNCEAPADVRPCDHCEPCRSIAEGRAVDVIEMDAASHTGVDDAREIIERVQFRPTQLRTKVYVIDETHMLSTAAFNALLKTLEEPPPHVLFILATTEFHKVPATIVSRCQRFVFNRHTIAEIATHLEEIARAEGVTLEPGVGQLIARAATGAMRDALSVLDQLMAGGDGTVRLTETQALLGATDSGEVVGLIRALADGNVQQALQIVNEVADGGADLRQYARDLVDRLRSLMLLSATQGDTVLDLPRETIDELQAISGRVDVAQVVQWLRLFSTLDYQLKSSPYGQLPIELAVVELLAVSPPAAEPVVSPARRTASPRVQPAPAGDEPAVATHAPASRPDAPLPPPPTTLPPPQTDEREDEPARVAVTTPPQPVNVIEVEDNAAFLLDEIVELWPQFVDDVRAESPLIYAQLDGASPINVEGQMVIVLANKGPWQKKRLEQEKTMRLLERTLSKLLHSQARMRITTDEREEMPDARKQIQHVRNDPLVRRAINIFEAQITGIDTP